MLIHTLGQVFKCIHDLFPQNICQQSKPVETHDSMTTHSATRNKLLVPALQLETSRKAFEYRGLCLWNLLDDDLVEIDGWTSFKDAIMASNMFTVV